MNQYLSKGRFWRLCLKELRESLRDRRTIVTLVLMPILVYPLLSMALQRLLIGGAARGEIESAYVLGVPTEQLALKLQGLLSEIHAASQAPGEPPIKILRTEEEKPKDSPLSSRKNVDESAIRFAPNHPGFKVFKVDLELLSMSRALDEALIDVAINELEVGARETRRGISYHYDLKLDFRQGDLRSESAMNELRRTMQMLNDRQAEFLRQRADGRIPPIAQLVARGVGKPTDASASILGVIPLVLILMTITGAVYPAIDLTAGERERGTMEALIATPAPRFALLLSKYVAVVCVAILTALANLFAAWLTLSFGGLGNAIFGKNGFSILTVVQMLPLLVIFAAFFSSILLALCSFARSFKEAQAYLIPVMLLSLGPGLVTLMPNIEFTTTLGIIPLINILLLSRDIMASQAALVPAFAAVFSTIIYAAATLVIAARLFGAEAATSGSQESWSDLLGRPKRLRDFPSIGELAIYLAALFPVFFVVSNAGNMLGYRGGQAMFYNAILLILLFVLLPQAFAWYRRLDYSKTFRLSLFGHADHHGLSRFARIFGGFLAAVLMSAGLWMVAFEAYLFLESWSLAGQISEEERVKLKATFLEIPFWVVILTGAIVPAVAEEFFFRGFTLSAMLSKLTPLHSILFTSALFGMFHVIAGSILSFEKLLPTFILGIALGFLAVRSQSLWPGVALHAIHNSLVFGMTRFSEAELAKWFGTDTRHLPIAWLLGGGLCIAAGAFVIWIVGRRTSMHAGIDPPKG